MKNKGTTGFQWQCSRDDDSNWPRIRHHQVHLVHTITALSCLTPSQRADPAVQQIRLGQRTVVRTCKTPRSSASSVCLSISGLVPLGVPTRGPMGGKDSGAEGGRKPPF